MNSFVSFHFNHLKVNRTVMLTRPANLDIFHFEYCLFRKYIALQVLFLRFCHFCLFLIKVSLLFFVDTLAMSNILKYFTRTRIPK